MEEEEEDDAEEFGVCWCTIITRTAANVPQEGGGRGG